MASGRLQLLPNHCAGDLSTDMGVSKNRGTPKWMVYFMENPIKLKWMIWGVFPLFLETPIFLQTDFFSMILFPSLWDVLGEDFIQLWSTK